MSASYVEKPSKIGRNICWDTKLISKACSGAATKGACRPSLQPLTSRIMLASTWIYHIQMIDHSSATFLGAIISIKTISHSFSTSAQSTAPICGSAICVACISSTLRLPLSTSRSNTEISKVLTILNPLARNLKLLRSLKNWSAKRRSRK